MSIQGFYPMIAGLPGFSGQQPVDSSDPAAITVGHGQPTSANWPGPNIVPPTNPVSTNRAPAFVGNQPNVTTPPALVDIDHGQPKSANWPQAAPAPIGTYP